MPRRESHFVGLFNSFSINTSFFFKIDQSVQKLQALSYTKIFINFDVTNGNCDAKNTLNNRSGHIPGLCTHDLKS